MTTDYDFFYQVCGLWLKISAGQALNLSIDDLGPAHWLNERGLIHPPIERPCWRDGMVKPTPEVVALLVWTRMVFHPHLEMMLIAPKFSQLTAWSKNMLAHSWRQLEDGGWEKLSPEIQSAAIELLVDSGLITVLTSGAIRVTSLSFWLTEPIETRKIALEILWKHAGKARGAHRLDEFMGQWEAMSLLLKTGALSADSGCVSFDPLSDFWTKGSRISDRDWDSLRELLIKFIKISEGFEVAIFPCSGVEARLEEWGAIYEDNEGFWRPWNYCPIPMEVAK